VRPVRKAVRVGRGRGAGDRVEGRRYEGGVGVQVGQDRGQARGEHGLAGTRFPQQEDVVSAGGGYPSPKPITNPLARTSLWFAVFSIPGMGITLIISVVLAIIALIRAQELPGRIGTREALAALIYDAFVVFFILAMYSLA